MYHISPVSNQLKLAGALLAIAVLAIGLMTVVFAAGPAQAQAQDPRTGDNAEEYSKPFPCSEEVEPDASTTELVRDGYYAVFEGFWDYEVGHLSNNFCPPKVTVTNKSSGRGTTTTITREDANIHISKTVFSIPDSYQVTVVDSRDETVNGNPPSLPTAAPAKSRAPP